MNGEPAPQPGEHEAAEEDLLAHGATAITRTPTATRRERALAEAELR